MRIACEHGWMYPETDCDNCKSKKTFRDELAMAALTGMLAESDRHEFSYLEDAVKAYLWADAMLAAREAPPVPQGKDCSS